MVAFTQCPWGCCQDNGTCCGCCKQGTDMTPSLKRALVRFENAVRNDAFSGAAHPDQRAYIEAECKKARASLIAQIEKLSTQEPS